MKKVITTILIICCFFTILTPAVSADECVFQDVTNQCLYKPDIIALYQDHIITGNKGKFYPNKKITYAEAIIILEKTFKDPDNLPAWQWWRTQSEEYKGWNNTWTDRIESNVDYMSAIPKEQAIQLIFDCIDFNINIFASEGLTNNIIAKLNAITYPRAPDLVGSDYIKRSQFCGIVQWIREHNSDINKLNSIIKNEIVSYHFSNNEVWKTDRARTEIALYVGLVKIPDCVIDAFIKKQSKINIYDQQIWREKFSEWGPQCIGLFHRLQNLISICGTHDTTIIHEFGHFVYYQYPECPQKVKAIYNNGDEVNNVILLAHRTYANTNEHEFFAESFTEYCCNPEKLQEYAPNVYNLIEEAIQYIAERYR